jgi:hypothetical protein
MLDRVVTRTEKNVHGLHEITPKDFVTSIGHNDGAGYYHLLKLDRTTDGEAGQEVV